MTDRLWAPWRIKYLLALGKKERGCVFCKIGRQKKDRQNYIFLRSQHAFSVLNIYPYNNGHALVIPCRHAGDFSKLSMEEKMDLMILMESTKSLLDHVLKPQGYNIGLNLGRVAGAGFPGHLHIHVVPRWRGDANFMPIVANTKVMSQSLAVLYGKLVKAGRK